jgi:hypothetical protein
LSKLNSAPARHATDTNAVAHTNTTTTTTTTTMAPISTATSVDDAERLKKLERVRLLLVLKVNEANSDVEALRQATIQLVESEPATQVIDFMRDISDGFVVV